MDEKNTLPDVSPEPVPKAPGFQLTLPLAIVIAGALVAGSIIYTQGGSVAQSVPEGITDASLSAWAKSLKLDMKRFTSCYETKKYTEKIEADVAQGSTLGVNGTPTFFINGQRLVGALPTEQFTAVIDTLLAGTPPVNPFSVTVSDADYVLGEANAPVTIIEFTDFQCPFCLRFWQNTLPHLTREYLDTGKAKLVLKHFPLNFHEGARPAASAAECAGEQGKFWQMHDLIFQKQSQ